MLMLLMLPTAIYSQLGDPIFTPYACRFDPAFNRVFISAVLLGSDGFPIERDQYTVQVLNSLNSSLIANDRLQLTPLSQRPPIQLSLVFDITDTVPIAQVSQAVNEHLIKKLLPEDEIAFVFFGSEVSPMTPFSINKDAAFREYFTDLRIQSGENKLYEGIYKAVNEQPFFSEKRQIVLVLTDSAPKVEENIENKSFDLSQITERANRTHSSIYAIGFYTRDRPDVVGLGEITKKTEGFLWLYGNENFNQNDVGDGVAEYLDDFIDALNAEIIIEAEISGQIPNIDGFLPLEIFIDLNNGQKIAKKISCQVESLKHSLIFVNPPQNETVSEGFDLTTSITSDLDSSLLEIAFEVNDEIVQKSGGAVYAFETQGKQPGYYTLGASLLNTYGDLLTTTPTAIKVYVQQEATFSFGGSPPDPVEKDLTLIVNTDPHYQLSPVEFSIAPVSDLKNVKMLSEPVAFEDGQAILHIPEMGQKIKALYGTEKVAQYEIYARIPGVSAQDPDQLKTVPLVVNIRPPQPVIPFRLADLQKLAPWLTLLALLIANFLVFRAIRRANIQRKIQRPDAHELSPQLMAVTVRREGIKQSYTLTRKTYSLGRGAGNDINLGDNPRISRQHGVIMWRDRRWIYTNSKSKTHVRINGKRKKGFVWVELTPITEIEIESTLVVFHSNAQQDIADYIQTDM
ncbi:hypothetical protein MASR2M15_28320 [Anaerolineales bacterium]